MPLGGLEEIGRNCSFFEYQNEIVVLDAGIQFPEEETPGIDYIIPNVSYLEARKRNVKALIFTHGHYDHIHALPYLLEKLGNPLIYAAALTRALVEKRLQEFPNLPKVKLLTVKDGDRVKLSEHFEVEFISVDHTIPDALGIVLKTPAGLMAHFGDFRIETTKDGKPTNIEAYKRIGAMGIHSAFIDSTRSLSEGFSLSENTVMENLESLFKQAQGRLIVATFASLLTRIAEIFKVAERLGRKVALNGRSMKDNVLIAQNLGYIKVKKGELINLEDIGRYPDNQLLILTTGAQGEPNAGLMRIVNNEHRLVQLKKTDTIIFSSSVVPGNERSVQGLQDNISRQVDEVYNVKLLDIHTGGHACAEDIKLVMRLVKPRFVVPVHAYYFMRKHLRKLAQEVGIPEERVVVMDNGQVAHLTKDHFTITNEEVPSFYVMVDGLGVGDVEEVVLRDRRVLSKEGMVVIICTIDRAGSRLLKHPDIISRGFIYLKDHGELLGEIRERIKRIVGRLPRRQIETEYVKSLIRDQIGQFLYNKTKRRPMILPVLIEI